MLARDYTYVGSKGSIVEAWATEETGGGVGSIGSGQDGAITISDKGGNVQIWKNKRSSSLGTKGRSPRNLMQPGQTALSADSALLAVADRGNNRIQLFDTTTRKVIGSVGTRGQIRPGRMQSPEGVVFVDGRCEMIVADTGNDRLQVFHVDTLAVPRDNPGSRTSEGFSPSPPVENVGNTPPSSRSPLAWTQSQGPSSTTNTTSGRAQKPPLPQGDAVGREPGVLNPQQGTPAAGAAAPGGVGDDASSACLLVFNGGEDAERLRKRRTAGESEAAEGPVRQPCDLAYWRPSGQGRGVEGHATAAWVWAPELPRWFRPHACYGGRPGLSTDDVDDEDKARKELLPPASPSQGESVPLRGDNNGIKDPLARDENKRHARGSVDGGTVDGKPLLGAFLVRETGSVGKLQLLFVAKTKAAEEAENSSQHQVEDPEKDADSAVVEHASDDGSESVGWMKQAASSGEGLGRRRGAEGTNELEAESSSQHSSPTPTSTFEVRDETIIVLEEGKGVEICGRVYDSLLSLLRAFRWGAFERLVGVADNRGDRGVVAVAERGGGRVRLLHYAPALPPFYATELAHLHSIEGLRRPSSVSFSPDGDLLVVDQGARKILVYSHLSGRWVRVREFGPDTINPDKGQGDVSGSDAPRICGHTRQHASGPTCETGKESACDDHPLRGPDACLVRGLSAEERTGKASAAAPGRGQEHDAAGRSQGNRDRLDQSRAWSEGTPISARFMRRKTGLGPCTPPDDDSRLPESTELVVAVASSDGVVRTLCGPRRRQCGSFAVLDEGMALSILELLGYRSSQVLGHVNRTMADLRSRLRLAWRLYPLTPGQLARRVLEFLQWGRRSTGEGLPGRGTPVDEKGKQLCDQFLSTSVCSRPACPYSHDQPWVGAISDDDADACIVFRGGVTHAVNNLYGQVFGWEWEGDLYRLFLERSLLRTMVTRRDPMTLGVHGAEAIRECEEQVGRVLDYPGFVDFVTVVHEHVLGLRSWHQSQPGEKEEIRAAPATRQPPVDAASSGVETEPHPSSKYAPPSLQKLDEATPWLGWDFAASNATDTRGTEHCSSSTASCSTDAIPGRKSFHNGKDAKAEPKDHGNIYHGGDRKGLEEDEKLTEEPKVNRSYGGTGGDDHGTSVNKLFAFQADRVVRMLDDIF
eukprot:g19371.t1